MLPLHIYKLQFIQVVGVRLSTGYNIDLKFLKERNNQL